MHNVNELLASRKALLAEARKIQETADKEERSLTEDEEADIVSKLDEIESLEGQIEEARKAESRRQQLQGRLTTAEEWEASPQPQATAIQQPQALAVQQPPPTSRQSVEVVGGEASRGWASFGEYLFKVREAAGSPFADPRLRDLSPQAAAPGIRGDVPSEGGFLVPVEYRQRLIERMYGEGELLSRLDQAGMRLSLAGNTLKIPYVDETSRAAGSRWGGVRGYWVEEAGSLTDSQPAYGQLTLELKKAGCLGYVTEEMVEDYGASGQFLERAFASELTFRVEEAVVRGDGAGKPLGIKNANCTISVAKETNQTATTIWGPNIVKMWARLWAGSRRNSVWLINQDVEPYLWSLTLEGRYGSASTAVEGIPLYYPAGSELNRGEYGILMGRPVIPVEHCDTLGTAGDIILFDPASYILADKATGIRADSSIHVKFESDQRTFRALYRVDGQPSWPSALTPAQGTNTLSPCVTLATRS